MHLVRGCAPSPNRVQYQRIYWNKYDWCHIESLFLFDTTNGFQANQGGTTYTYNFARNFSLIPRVGLAVYTMDFEYSPTFSCQVSSNTTTTSATLIITTTNTGQNNQLYLMYIATDHDFMGVFMPGALGSLFLT